MIIILFRLKQRPFQLAELLIAINHILNGGSIQRFDFLLHMGNLPLGGYLAAALIRLQFAFQHHEKAGFTGAVTPGKANVPSGMGGKAGVLKKLLVAALQRNLGELNHEI